MEPQVQKTSKNAKTPLIASSVIVAFSLTLALGWKLGQQSATQTPANPTLPVAGKVEGAAGVNPIGTPNSSVAGESLTAEAILDGIPEAKKESSANKEVQRFREAARKNENSAKNWINLGDALMQRSREQLDPHDYDWAKLAYQQALKIDPQKPDAMTGMAWVTGALHQFDDSIAWAKQAIAVTPNDAAPYGLLGDAQLELGDYETAFESYQKMLDIRPDLSSYSRGAHLLYVTGDTRKALWLMQKAIEAGSPFAENTAWCKAQLAEMLWNMGAVLPAKNVVDKALKVSPENYHLLLIQGRVCEANHDTKGAIAAYQKAIAISPQHHALVALGDLYLSLGKKEEAEKLFTQVETTHQHHQTHGNHDELYMARFWVDHDRNLERAKEVVAKRLAQGEPKSLSDLDIVAWVLYKTGDIPNAVKYAKKAIAKGSQDSSRLFHAGMILTKAGELREGQKLLSKALTLNPAFNPVDAKTASETLKTIAPKLRVSEQNLNKGKG
jgi:tetratricopeptide (TPR) repeat protein